MTGASRGLPREMEVVGVLEVTLAHGGIEQFPAYLGCACCGEPVAIGFRGCFGCEADGVCDRCGTPQPDGIPTAWFERDVVVRGDDTLMVTDGRDDVAVLTGWSNVRRVPDP